MAVRAKSDRVISGEYGNGRGIHVCDASLVAESLSFAVPWKFSAAFVSRGPVALIILEKRTGDLVSFI